MVRPSQLRYIIIPSADTTADTEEKKMKFLSASVFAMQLIACAWCAMMTGGLKELEPNDEGLKNTTNWAVNRHNAVKNDAFRSDLVEITKAQGQVVAGMKYVITVKMARTSCRKDRANEECGPTAEHYECTFTVWSRPWMNDIRMVKDTCAENQTSL